MGRQQGSAATVTNFHTDSRASLRSAAGSSACPRCAAGRYAAGIKRASDGWWGERSHQFMIQTMRSSRLEGAAARHAGLAQRWSSGSPQDSGRVSNRGHMPSSPPTSTTITGPWLPLRQGASRHRGRTDEVSAGWGFDSLAAHLSEAVSAINGHHQTSFDSNGDSNGRRSSTCVQRPIHRVCGIAQGTRHHMGVQVHGDRKLRLVQHVHHHTGRHALRQKQRSRRVP
jgi:hypothetical protein